MPQPAWVKGRLAPEPYLSRLFYGLIIKRSSTYMTAVMIVATTVGTRSLPMLTPGLRASRKRCAPLPFLLFLLALTSCASLAGPCPRAGIGYDYMMNGVWNTINKGVRRARPQPGSCQSRDA